MPVCDLHLDTALEIQGGADLGSGNPEGHVDLTRMREGGAGLLVFACFVPSVLPHGRVFREAMDLLNVIDRTCLRSRTAMPSNRTWGSSSNSAAAACAT